jgi:hypothetical protein
VVIEYRRWVRVSFKDPGVFEPQFTVTSMMILKRQIAYNLTESSHSFSRAATSTTVVVVVVRLWANCPQLLLT